MQKDFWHGVWARDSLGFHQDEVHPFLKRYSDVLFAQSLNGNTVATDEKSNTSLEQIFVPLCGKSLDIAWLAQYFEVTGTELSEIACRNFFTEHGLTPTISVNTHHKVYQFKNITLWQGDHFQLSAEQLTQFSWIYDRAALIALPKAMQADYVKHLTQFIDQGAKLLLISLEFPSEQLEGPPFPIFATDVQTLFSGYHIQEYAQRTLPEKQFARRQFNVDFLIERLYLIQKRD